jgi:hypothetical protein
MKNGAAASPDARTGGLSVSFTLFGPNVRAQKNQELN